MKKPAGAILIAAGLLGLFLLRDATPLARLAAASIGMIWIIKLAALLWQSPRFTSKLGLLAYFAWPGVSTQGFTDRAKEPPPHTGQRFLESWLSMICGVIFLLTVSLEAKGQSTLLNYAALISALFIVHLGLVEVAADGFRLMGFHPSSLFDRPFLASSLRDFWSFRWNRAFVDMNKIFLLKPLQGRMPNGFLVFSIFLVSGLLHELAISYPAGRGWGLPLTYFLIQGIGMELERHWKLPRALALAWIFLPLPLLFPPTFVNLFFGALAQAISSVPFEPARTLKHALFAGSLAHLLVLCASVQVPGKLGWKTEFAKLSSLNRKVFWTYGAYILCIIIFMSLVSFALALSPLDLSNTASLFWLGFIALFWWARVLTDFFYMKHEDWPQGPLFTVGHIALTTLFVSLALLYTTVAIVAFLFL